MTSISAVSAQEARYLDFAGAVEVLHSMGLTDVTERMVRRYADKGVLPFFGGSGSGFGKRRRIAEDQLRLAVRGMQLDAVRGTRRR